jgi:hypothetical protein
MFVFKGGRAPLNLSHVRATVTESKFKSSKKALAYIEEVFPISPRFASAMENSGIRLVDVVDCFFMDIHL